MNSETSFAIALFIYLVFTEVRNFIERRQLLDRIMARDFQDYVIGETERKLRVPDKIKRDGDAVPL